MRTRTRVKCVVVAVNAFSEYKMYVVCNERERSSAMDRLTGYERQHAHIRITVTYQFCISRLIKWFDYYCLCS